MNAFNASVVRKIVIFLFGWRFAGDFDPALIPEALYRRTHELVSRDRIVIETPFTETGISVLWDIKGAF